MGDYLVCHRFTQMKHRFSGGRNLIGPNLCLSVSICGHKIPATNGAYGHGTSHLAPSSPASADHPRIACVSMSHQR